jgi:hypothetical protein
MKGSKANFSGGSADTLIKQKKDTSGKTLHTDRPGRSKLRGAHHQGSRQVHEENLPEVWDKEVLPSSSPDFRLLDYFVWGVSEL